MDGLNSVNANSTGQLRLAPVESAATAQPVSADKYASSGREAGQPGARVLVYTTGNDGRRSVFDNRKDADEFTWKEYKATHPDATEQGHTDNNWDVFKRGLTDTVKNPLGETISQIAKWSGSSPQTQRGLYASGNNPLGYAAKELGAAAGASAKVQDELEEGGGLVESAIPAWGQARFYGEMTGDAANGKPPSLGDARNIAQDAKSISATNLSPARRNITQENTEKPSFNPPRRLGDGRIGYPLSPTRAPRLPDANTGAPVSPNREVLDQRVRQSPYSKDSGSYPNTVKVINDALKRGNVGLSETSLANIRKNMDSVDSRRLTHAQASARESGSFAKDAMNARLPVKDRLAAVAGAVINGTVGPAYMAEKDISEHLKNRSSSRTEIKAVMDGMMTHDPLYNH